VRKLQRAGTVVDEQTPAPDDAFVKAHWALLRDGWIGKNPAIRSSACRSFRVARLGDDALPISKASQELAFLKTCRNTSRARSIVLEHLLAVGTHQQAGEGPNHPAASLQPAPRQSHTAAWAVFEAALATSISQLTAHQFLIIGLRRSPEFFVQIGVYDDTLRVETSSNSYLEEWEQFTEGDERELIELGWHLPTGTSNEDAGNGSPNHFVDFPAPEGIADAARIMVATLKTFYDVTTPSHLVYQCFSDKKGSDDKPMDILLPGLGIPHEAPQWLAKKAPEPAPLTYETLCESTKVALTTIIGSEPQHLDGEDGFVIPTKELAIIVRVNKDTPIVRIWAAAVWDVTVSSSLHGAINDFNVGVLWIRAVLRNDTVGLEGELHGDPLQVYQFGSMLNTIANEGGAFARQLHTNFGGTSAFADALPAQKEPALTAGYL